MNPQRFSLVLRFRVLPIGLAAVLVLPGLTPPVSAQDGPEVPVTLILGSDTDPFDYFGTDAHLADSTLIVGAPGRVPQAGGPYGAAYIFRLTGEGPMGGWQQEAVLTHATTGTSAGIDVGSAVSYARLADLPGTPTGSLTEFVVVGDREGILVNQALSGALFVWRREGESWVEDVDSLIPEGAGDGDHTGSTAALVALGGAATGGLVAASRSGTDLVLFERSVGATPPDGRWSEVARLPAGGSAFFADPWTLDATSSGNGALAVVPGGGGVRVYRRMGGAAGAGLWQQEALLMGSEVGPDDRFGSSVAAYGAGRLGSGGTDWALVGAPFRPSENPNAPGGAAYLFRYTGSGPMNGWEEAAILRASEPRGGFGWTSVLGPGPGGLDGPGGLIAGVEGNGPFEHLYREASDGVWR